MKKQLLFYFSFFTIFTATSQLTFVPDDNFEYALIDLGYDTGPLDDYVPTVNIENVTELYLVQLNISDLTGIEDFSNLEELYCDLNNLSNLNITQNLLLAKLRCNENNLSSLDVSQNLLLTELWFSENSLSNIDVSQNTNLLSLSVHTNPIHTLDISQNLILTHLSCGSNLLTNLDISQNSNLIALGCSNNQLKTLDLSQNPFLRTLVADNNQLVELDVSQNLELLHFSCEGNQLINLDVRLNTNLTNIFCNNNQLTYLDIRNGNNQNIGQFHFVSTFNPNLTCILVDDVDYSTTTWTEIDPASTFVETQAECDLLSINTFEESNFNLYPNPAQNILTIETNTPFKTLEIYTLLGQKVVESTSKIIDVSKLNSGLYVVIIEDEANKTIVKRFIKQ